MRIRVSILAVCLAALPAFAQDKATKPTLSAKSRSIKVEITIDEKLRADPRFYQDLLKEAQRFIEERALEADKEWRADKTMFRMGPWEYERGYFLDAAAGPYLGVSVTNYSYTGGAHPNLRTNSILWNREQGRRASIAELFRETNSGGQTMTALAKLIREEVAKEKRERGVEVEEPLEQDPSLSGIKADLKTFGEPLLVPSTLEGKLAGIDFHFSAYDVGAYAEGAYGGYLPWQVLEPYLTERARALFGGERRDDGGKQKSGGK